VFAAQAESDQPRRNSRQEGQAARDRRKVAEQRRAFVEQYPADHVALHEHLEHLRRPSGKFATPRRPMRRAAFCRASCLSAASIWDSTALLSQPRAIFPACHIEPREARFFRLQVRSTWSILLLSVTERKL